MSRGDVQPEVGDLNPFISHTPPHPSAEPWSPILSLTHTVMNSTDHLTDPGSIHGGDDLFFYFHFLKKIVYVWEGAIWWWEHNIKHASSIGHVEDDSRLFTHWNLEIDKRQRNFPMTLNASTCNKVMGFPSGSAIKNLPAVWDTRVQFLGGEDPLEEGMATDSIILAWRISWTEEPGGLRSTGSQRVGHNCSDWAHTQVIKLRLHEANTT